MIKSKLSMKPPINFNRSRNTFWFGRLIAVLSETVGIPGIFLFIFIGNMVYGVRAKGRVSKIYVQYTPGFRHIPCMRHEVEVGDLCMYTKPALLVSAVNRSTCPL